MWNLYAIKSHFEDWGIVNSRLLKKHFSVVEPKTFLIFQEDMALQIKTFSRLQNHQNFTKML